MTDLFAYAESRQQNWRNTDPPTSKYAGLSTDQFKTDHHAAILNVLRRSPVPLAAEQIADSIALAHASGKCAVCLDYVAVGKRSSELIDAGLIERTPETHQNRSGRFAFKLRIKEPQSVQAAWPKPEPPE